MTWKILAIWLTAVTLANQAAAESPVRIVTDIAPVAAIAKAVAGQEAQVQALIPAGADPHDFALKISQARDLEAADQVVWIGPALTPGLEKVIATIAEEGVSLPLMEADAKDPHGWLDPEAAAGWMQRIGAALAEADPGAAEAYRARAEAAAGEVLQRHEARKEGLKSLGEVQIWVYHDALEHFARSYGLKIAGALSDADGHDISARRVAEMRAAFEGGAGCLVLEPGTDPERVARLIENRPARLVAVDILGRETAWDYNALLDKVAVGLAGCR